ncbi:MAG: AsmA family protein, partial [Halioglobus sp.]|nr:AsmA family protein [Halioglobus sp.]
MPRILLITVAALLALIVGAVLLVPMFLDKEKVVALAADAIKEHTGATLEVNGDLDLTVFPRLGIAFTRASITLPEREQADVEVGSARVGVALLPLLTGSVQIDSIAVDDLTLRMQAAAEEPRAATEGMTDEQLTAWYAERRKQREAQGSAAGAEAVLAVPLALNVAALDLRDARLETFDAATGQTSVIELRSLAARDLNLDGRPIPVSLELRIPGDQPVDVKGDGRFVIQQDSDTVTLENLAVTVAGATAEPLTLTLNGSADLARQSAETAITLALGPTRGEGSLRFASFESPQVDANLALNLLDPALLALAGPEAVAEAGDAEPADGDAPLPLDALRSIDTRAALRIEQARLGAHTIENLGMQLRAKEGVINLTEVRGRLHGGQLSANATFNGRLNTATLDTRGGLTGLDLGTALQAMESPDLLSGSANLDWQLTSRGGTLNALIAALEGPVTLTTDAVVLKGTSVEKLICQAVALTNQESLTATFAPDTRFRALAATVNVTDGRAVLNPLTAELPGIALSGSGHLDLLQQTFDTRFKARLSNELEQVDVACRVSKRLLALDFPVN